MAWHNRYIIPNDPSKPSGGLRQTVTFIREDLLWHSKKPLIDPHRRAKKSGGDFVATNFSRAIVTNNQSIQNS